MRKKHNKSLTKKEIMENVCREVRQETVKKYGTNLAGHCIEASETIKDRLNKEGIEANTVEGWCEFEKDVGYTNFPFDPHTWTEAFIDSEYYYLDVTADQFAYAIIEEIPPVIIGKMPDYMSYLKPVF